MNIKLTKSLIFDAVCTCSFLAGQESNLNPTQKNVIDILKPRANGRIADGIMSYSTLCLIISEYISDPEKATIDDLCNMFESITEVDMAVRPKIKGEFVQSFIYQALDILKMLPQEDLPELLMRTRLVRLQDADFRPLLRPNRSSLLKKTPSSASG